MNGDRYGGEKVYVVPRCVLFRDGAPHGFLPGADAWLPLIRESGHFADRAGVEEDATLQQIIPYALIMRGDEFFVFRRTSGGGEKRLHGLRSVGVGGHVNPEDRLESAANAGRGGDVVEDALRRELAEEVVLPIAWGARFVGLLNDDTSPVGSVHVGLVAVVEIDARDDVRVREHDTMTGAFLGRADLLDLHARERESFETWSALLIDRFDEVLTWARPHAFSSPTPNPTPISSI